MSCVHGANLVLSEAKKTTTPKANLHDFTVYMVKFVFQWNLSVKGGGIVNFQANSYDQVWAVSLPSHTFPW